ncbi:DUF6150 family protein [Hymenobacter guriensis]|uniref:DUF6150 family protein n=1 Tax=Hymenobacter guriensis TaxID=2793065 RepID=UPI001E5223F5|nr:DUF6150 family protein [Hymenobacter guriensis]
MLTSLLLSGFLTLNPFQPAPAVPFTAATVATSVEPCRIYGSIFLEKDPRRRGQSFATVYVEPEEAFADVLVYEESNKLFADKTGFWYFTGARDFADYVLFVTDNRALADFSIQYTKIRSYAGCRNGK